MDQFRLAEMELRLRHRHGDEWVPMEGRPLHHGAPEHDVERGWLRGLLFRCATCDEEVVVEPAGEGRD
jgi:hypothetical protein